MLSLREARNFSTQKMFWLFSECRTEYNYRRVTSYFNNNQHVKQSSAEKVEVLQVSRIQFEI
ncbi:CLUMA_CG010876, isoform A [Clunio marinus]|uniref:CLUMA_CG010876, isoform A n=1 Tax=Clunio marinus TaxID=568069 RepID=A0A1J1IB22_9DIPT|nr:CLUMA_CG010876, isoform A [Clunio marinus]